MYRIAIATPIQLWWKCQFVPIQISIKLLQYFCPFDYIKTTFPSILNWKWKIERKLDIHQGHYNDVIMSEIASQITSLTIVCSIVYSDADQTKHQSSASLAFVRGIHRGPVNSPHKWPVTRKLFPFDDVIMKCLRPVSLSGSHQLHHSCHKIDT